MNFPDKKYNIIYADPPWPYKDKANAGKRGAVHKYDLMSDEDLKELPVYKLADEVCALFMWATAPKMPEAIELIKAWGFEYKTFAFVWIKKNMNGSIFMGMGNTTRSNAEFILYGVKNNPKRIDAGISQVIEEPEVISTVPKAHSVKPNIFRNKIIKLMGDLPRIELFARTKVHGWDTWGNDEKLNSKPLEEFV